MKFTDSHARPIGSGSSLVVGCVLFILQFPAYSKTIIDLTDEPIGQSTAVMSIVGATPYHMLGAGGASMTMADFNRDGYDDLAVAAPSATTIVGGAGSGEIYLFYGEAGAESVDINLNSDPNGLASSRIFGGVAHERAGASLASGDINGDGFEDLIVGAPASIGSGTQNAGTVYVVYGGEDLSESDIELGVSINSTGVTRILGNEAADVTGWAVAAGDINSDGFDDVIFSSLDWGNETSPGNGAAWKGKVRIVYGSESLPKTTIDLGLPTGTQGETTIIGVDDFISQRNGDQFGRSLATGDVNGDGYSDVIVGAPTSDGPDHSKPNAGEVWVIYGSATIPNSTLDLSQTSVQDQATVILGDRPFKQTGFSVASGDFNGDGYADVLTGAPYMDRTLVGEYLYYPAFEVGQLELIFGEDSLPGSILALDQSPSLLNTGEIAQIVGPASSYASGPIPTGGRFGWAVGASDLNADGRDDILASAPFLSIESRRDPGQVSILYGSPALEGASIDLFVDQPDIRLDGRGILFEDPQTSEFLGKAFAGGGDMNRDGFPEVFTSIPFSDNPDFSERRYHKAGEIIGLFGEGSETVVTKVLFTRSGNAPATNFGPAVRCSIDFVDGSNTSRTEVSLTRETMKGIEGNFVSWQVQTDRQDYTQATVRFRYLPHEVDSVAEGELRLAFSTDGESFGDIPGQTIDFSRNEITASVGDINGTFKIGSSGVEVTATPTLPPETTPTQDPNATSTPFPADMNLDGRVDAEDLMIFLEDWMKEETSEGGQK
ncbi:MAG: FG-GAP repeat protein [Candidatus Omnitrophica bacterium]|nr:FG-GAP repeat protein [Candidatus Omnitrophota bacterium]